MTKYDLSWHLLNLKSAIDLKGFKALHITIPTIDNQLLSFDVQTEVDKCMVSW